MRGKAFANTVAVQLPGITPAYAGKRKIAVGGYEGY